ncbi:hypothetical protein QIG52_26675, partial [Klebsiella pneumoniae]|nr:hypothetical protein [Klebsiella pneumoniae]
MTNAIAAVGLCAVKRGVGGFDQPPPRKLSEIAPGDTEARRHGQHGAAGQNDLVGFQRGANSLCQGVRFAEIV